jgi:catechol 2,3-dioxygenase-like lactoylglutathione lyase family enzyme
MTLTILRAESRLPAQDLDRARSWYADKLSLHPAEERPGGLHYETPAGDFCLFASTGRSNGSFTQFALTVQDLPAAMAELRARGVVFHEYDAPGLHTEDGIARISGNYPSRGSGELGAWFSDSEGNLLAIGQPLP